MRLDASIRAVNRRRHSSSTPAVIGRRSNTSAEVLQELLHAYLPVRRLRELDAALALASGAMAEIWALERADVDLARELERLHPALAARDLCHLASCRRRGVRRIETVDGALARAVAEPTGGN